MVKNHKLQISSSFTLQHKLQSIIQNQIQNQHNWAYAILWNLTTTTNPNSQPLLSWGHPHFEPYPAHDDDILCKASGDVVWLNNLGHHEGSERAKQAQRYGIQTLVCIPTSNGVFEFGSHDVIMRDDSNLVEQVNAEFGFYVNSTNVKYAKEVINPNVSRMDTSSLISYIDELLMKIEELESQVQKDGSENSEEMEVSSRDRARVIEVDVKIIGEECVIRVVTKNVEYGLAKLMGGLRDLGLKVHHVSMSNLKDITLQNVVVGVPMDLGFTHQAIKEALLTILHQTP